MFSYEQKTIFFFAADIDKQIIEAFLLVDSYIQSGLIWILLKKNFNNFSYEKMFSFNYFYYKNFLKLLHVTIFFQSEAKVNSIGPLFIYFVGRYDHSCPFLTNKSCNFSSLYFRFRFIRKTNLSTWVVCMLLGKYLYFRNF